MIAKLFFCLPLRRALTHFPSNFSTLTESYNVTNSNVHPQNLFLNFVTTRFNISSADAAKMSKSYPRLLRLKTLDNVQEIVSVLNRHGCNEDQIVKVIRTQPTLLSISAERLLEPKIQLLKDYGVEAVDFISRFPRILATRLHYLRSNLELMKTVFPTQDILNRVIRNNPHILRKNLQDTWKPSVAFWEDFGFRGTELTKFSLLYPWALTRSSLTPEQFDLLHKIGIPKESKWYKYIVGKVATSRIGVAESKMDNLQLCGLSPEEALQVVRVWPSVLKYSTENIKKKMDFMLNHVEIPVDFVAKHPGMLSSSVDKVMRPRFLVLQTMTARNVGEKVDPTRLFTILRMTEGNFVGQIIERHPESAALWTVYKNAIANVSKRSDQR